MKGHKKRICVLASGRGTNLQSIIEGCSSGEINGEVALVISDKKEAMALKRATDNGAEALFINPMDFPDRESFDTRVGDEIEGRSIDIICLAGYMRILSSSFVKRFYGKIINIHPALLPSFPGLHGQRQALEYGVRFAGATVHFVDEGVDTGPIIIQAVVPVYPHDDEQSLSDRILKLEHVIYRKALGFLTRDMVELKGRKVYIKDANWLEEEAFLINPK